MTTNHDPEPASPLSPKSLRVHVVRATITGVISAVTRVLLTWLVEHRPGQ